MCYCLNETGSSLIVILEILRGTEKATGLQSYNWMFTNLEQDSFPGRPFICHISYLYKSQDVFHIRVFPGRWAEVSDTIAQNGFVTAVRTGYRWFIFCLRSLANWRYIKRQLMYIFCTWWHQTNKSYQICRFLNIECIFYSSIFFLWYSIPIGLQNREIWNSLCREGMRGICLF